MRIPRTEGLRGLEVPHSSRPAAPQDLEFSYNSQDGWVMTPGSTVVAGVSTEGGGVSSERLRLKGGLRPEQGAFVYSPEDRRHYAANAFAAASRALTIFEEAWGKPIAWATGRPQLEVTADQGKALNAHYSRWDHGIFFFHDVDAQTGDTVYTAGSGEVVAHEIAHAILDGLRPAYFSAWSPDAAAFHESFGDILAMLVSLHDDRVLDRVVEQTGGDLSRPNLAAAMGEQLGRALNHQSGHNLTGGDYTRNAIHNLVWQDPVSLPDSAPADQLSSEHHSFSRVFTGAFYDLLTGICQQKQGEGQDPRAALASTAREGVAMLARMLAASPEGDFTFKDMAAALLQSEREHHQGRYSAQILQAFRARKILPEEGGLLDPVDTLPSGSYTLQHRLGLSGPLEGVQVTTVLSGHGPDHGLKQSELERERLEGHIERAWRRGDILMTEPNQAVTRADLFKPDGEPYQGVVRWVEGQMVLERVPIGCSG